MSLQQQLNAALAKDGIEIRGPVTQEYAAILTPDALRFVASIHNRFEETRRQLLQNRQKAQVEISAGRFPDFPAETKQIRESDWKVAPIPKDLTDRRVEITGPVTRKMIINALNSGAKVFMADFEDSNSPTWTNNVEGQINLRDAVNRSISFNDPNGKKYTLIEKPATLMVRPRGWHLVESHVLVNGQPIAGAFFDFGLYFYHNAKNLLQRGSGPYFYVPKMEHYLECRLWAEVFQFSEQSLSVPTGSIRATALIETILAAFQMDEFLYELRNYSAGLNCGRWDYIFSFIKKFYDHPQFVMPDRGSVDMLQPFMQAYVSLLIKTCHRRGIHAMGGMAAQIPVRDNKQLNDAAMEKVRKDKLREVQAGHDGTWVAHPGLIKIAMDIFNEHMQTPNQIHRVTEAQVKAADLMAVPTGKPSLNGLRGNIEVGLKYVEAWIKGNGCVPIHNLMEDLATAEISRVQIQQWMRHGVKLSDGEIVTEQLVRKTLDEETSKLFDLQKGDVSVKKAKDIFEKMFFGGNGIGDFMSLEMYPYVITDVAGKAKL
ncbi:malate synthase [Planoprotostelium fungivorum]|uniref:malate synthase n=1 Tax=Planoprotostelium fungivorum TaxID=1890364 RepID=A0A2P6NKN4_9EUKA|nr:malate synthase [Planoprotostelium fungivorum]